MRTSPLSSYPVLTFSDYFKLNFAVEEVVAYFGYTFQSQMLTLPHSSQPIAWYEDLYTRLTTSLPYISLTSEIARREFLIAPVLVDLARYNHVKVRSEFFLEVSEQLKGTIDYFVQAQHQLLIIEAKNADLERGFTQLATELIALDQWSDEQTSLLYGAISIGNVWQFGLLERTTKAVTQDLNLYRVPADLKELLQILVAILTENSETRP